MLVMAALCYPAVFARVCAEIDAVCGDGGVGGTGGDGGADKANGADKADEADNGAADNPRLRLRCIADMPSLPFVSAIVKGAHALASTRPYHPAA